MKSMLLPANLAAGNFKEMVWRVNNLRYRKGKMDSIQLNSGLSDLEEV